MEFVDMPFRLAHQLKLVDNDSEKEGGQISRQTMIQLYVLDYKDFEKIAKQNR